MTKEKQINIILEEIDKAYTIPTYMEKRVRESIAAALEKISEENRDVKEKAEKELLLINAAVRDGERGVIKC